MSALKKFFGVGEREAVWRQLADQVEGRFIEAGFFGTDVVQATTGDWIITLDVYTEGGGESSTTYTRVRAPYVNPEGFRFTAYRAGFFSELGKMLGAQDIEVGDPFFDRKFVIKGNSEPRVRSFFANEEIRTLVAAQPKIRLDVLNDEGYFGPRYPEAVDQLRFLAQGVMKDVEQLRGVFDLFAEALHQLSHDGRGYDDDVALHIRRLAGPGGEIRRKDLLLWEGDEARRDAAEALGQLKDPGAVPTLLRVLHDPDIPLRARAIAALGEIGDPRAAPGVIRIMGASRVVDEKPLSVWAAEALRMMGAAPVADALLAALRGDPSALGASLGEYRISVIQALVTAVDGTGYRAALSALEEIDAVEALPELKSRLRSMASGIPKARAIAAVAGELEAQASLPRPAQAPKTSRDRLPRPASDPGPAKDTLPRASQAED